MCVKFIPVQDFAYVHAVCLCVWYLHMYMWIHVCVHMCGGTALTLLSLPDHSSHQFS